MALIIVGTEKNFTALRSRVFGGVSVSTKVAKEVADAVAAANPGVDLKKLEPGTVLEVPDHPKVKVGGEISLDTTTKEVLNGLANQGTAALADLVATARNVEADGAAERKQLGATLAGKDLADAARADKSLAADIAAVQQAVDAEETAAQARAAALQAAQAEWNAELKSLQGFVPS